jgi:CDP-paratose 2-epimerase
MSKTRRILITGGAGFIGTNLAKNLLEEGQQVVLFDNISRAGVQDNLSYLRNRFKTGLEFIHADVRDRSVVQQAVANAEVIYHLAAQVAVTTSVDDPLNDFSVNAAGTINVLEAARQSKLRPTVLFTSTNKVYGSLEDVALVRRNSHYEPAAGSSVAGGIDESRNLDFHSPYGCSKGCADQYVLDYGRCYGFRTIVFRMSCICGPHQQGTEDQGWVAFFVKKIMLGEPITIYGDGHQVRDVLFVTDLVKAFRLATEGRAISKSQAFNIGGGTDRAGSVLEVIDLVQKITGISAHVKFGPARIGDQRWYVSNYSRFSQATGWTPKVGLRDSVQRLADWFSANYPIAAVGAEQGSTRCATL